MSPPAVLKPLRQVAGLRLYAACFLLILMFLPTLVGSVMSIRTDAGPLELGWEGVVPQTDPDYCGPAVIATLLAMTGIEASDTEVAAGAILQAGGISLAEFARLAYEYGFPGQWFDVSQGTDIASLPHPAVVHLHWSSGHFAIVERAVAGFIQLADPARGRVLVPEERFAREWSGRIYLFDLVGMSGKVEQW